MKAFLLQRAHGSPTKVEEGVRPRRHLGSVPRQTGETPHPATAAATSPYPAVEGQERAAFLLAEEELPMPDKKPNILILWGDDIGQHNLSCYSHGVMGYKTPNIDRLSDEGVMFTD